MEVSTYKISLKIRFYAVPNIAKIVQLLPSRSILHKCLQLSQTRTKRGGALLLEVQRIQYNSLQHTQYINLQRRLFTQAAVSTQEVSSHKHSPRRQSPHRLFTQLHVASGSVFNIYQSLGEGQATAMSLQQCTQSPKCIFLAIET